MRNVVRHAARRPLSWLIFDVGQNASAVNATYTRKQGQYLAFIYYYTKLNRCSPAEADIQRYFGVSPPSVHHMILTLERHGFISRVPGQARSITLRVAQEELPKLE